MIAVLTATWADAGDDVLVGDTSGVLIEEINKAATSRGCYNRYRYLNYALDSQRPIDGYGPESKTGLQEASRKYDPKGFFQSSLSGSSGFKLF